MKGTHFFLMAMGMLCWVVWGKGAITTHYEDGDLVVWTDNPGESGYKGCDAAHMTPVVAYVFELQRLNSGGMLTCSAGSRGRWRTIGTQNSDDGRTVFTNIPEGHYRVICRVGKAIGCEIVGAEEGYPGRSIVYEREVSGVVGLGVDKREEVDLGVGDLGEDGLVVFPNPASAEISILFRNDIIGSEVSISIFDLLGKKLHEEKDLVTQGKNSIWKVSVKNYSSGTYIVLLKEEGGAVWQHKFVVMGE